MFLHAGENEAIIGELTPYLADRLKDADPGVRMAAVSAIYEIFSINPNIFKVTIPLIFKLLQEASNNWVLIKLVKLLAEFATVEPRVLTKLRPVFMSLMQQ